MQKDTDALQKDIIQAAVQYAGLTDYTGQYSELGGGELNDTFLLHCADRDLILRVSRFSERAALKREERALKLLDSVSGVPKLIFFDEEMQIDGRTWIMESYQPGRHVDKLSAEQFQSLGTLLAKVHKVKNEDVSPNPWKVILGNCHRFGDEAYLLAHPDLRLRKQFQALKKESVAFNAKPRTQCLRHCDMTPSNTLVDGSKVSLIDWELSGFGDPMTDFSTGYWSDMELNNGKWRQQLTAEERQALYSGYKLGGGIIDEQAILFYERIDKIGVATYLFWRLHVSDWQARDGMSNQYEIDYKNILRSLEAAKY